VQNFTIPLLAFLVPVAYIQKLFLVSLPLFKVPSILCQIFVFVSVDANHETKRRTRLSEFQRSCSVDAATGTVVY
jgi:hypothetical protein